MHRIKVRLSEIFCRYFNLVTFESVKTDFQAQGLHHTPLRLYEKFTSSLRFHWPRVILIITFLGLQLIRWDLSQQFGPQ